MKTFSSGGASPLFAKVVTSCDALRREHTHHFDRSVSTTAAPAVRKRFAVRLRQELRWKMSLLRFVDINYELRGLARRGAFCEESKQSGAAQVDSFVVRELRIVLTLLSLCAEVKEPIPPHVRNMVMLILGSLLGAHLQGKGKYLRRESDCRETTATGIAGVESILEEQLTSMVSKVLQHLLLGAPPSPAVPLVDVCQGLFFKYAIPCGTEVCGIINNLIVGDEKIAEIQAQIAGHRQAVAQALPSKDRAAYGTPSIKRSSSSSLAVDSDPPSAPASGASVSKKQKTAPPPSDARESPILPTTPHTFPSFDIGVQGADASEQRNRVQKMPSRLHTPATAQSTGAAAATSSPRGSTSKLRTNNSFLAAIMAAPAASPEPAVSAPRSASDTPASSQPQLARAMEGSPTASVSSTFMSSIVSKPASTTAVTHVRSEPPSRPPAVARVSKKFGAGF